jgi:uncharacterized protein YqhQ
LVFLDPFICSFQLIQEETRGKGIEALEFSSKDEDNEDTDDVEEDSGEEAVTTAAAVMVRIVLTTMNPLRRLHHWLRCLKTCL